jgi:hypothetical protein
VSDDKVIQAFPKRGEVPECPVEVERRLGFCRHERVRLVEQDRTVVCVDCGATLDPFAYLVEGAYAMRNGWGHYREVCRRIEERREQLAKLDKEKSRLQAAVRRLKEKAGNADTLDLRKPL